MAQTFWKTVWQFLKKPQSQQGNTSSVWPSNPTPSYLPKRNESVCPHDEFYVNVHRSFIFNNERIETTQMFSTEE